MDNLGSIISLFEPFYKPVEHNPPPSYETDNYKRDLEAMADSIGTYEPNRKFLTIAGVIASALILSSQV